MLNDQQFADAVIETTLRTLRDQEDARGELAIEGRITFSPSVFNTVIPNEYRFAKRSDVERRFPTDKKFLLLGPFKFTKRFSNAPEITYGQQPQIIQDGKIGHPQVGIATSYTPFLVQPSTFDLTITNGEVDGFYVGLYALTRPPRGVTTHIVSWRATGSASRYGDVGMKQAWTQSYDYNEASFLKVDG